MTLQITDAQIDKRYRIERSRHFNKIWKVSFVISVAYFIRHIILKATDPSENYNQLIDAGNLLLIDLLFGFLVYYKPEKAPYIVYLLAIYVCVFSNLVFRDQVPEFMRVEDKLLVDDKIMATLVGVYCLNYTSYIWTTIILPPLFLISYFC